MLSTCPITYVQQSENQLIYFFNGMVQRLNHLQLSGSMPLDLAYWTVVDMFEQCIEGLHHGWVIVQVKTLSR